MVRMGYSFPEFYYVSLITSGFKLVQIGSKVSGSHRSGLATLDPPGFQCSKRCGAMEVDPKPNAWLFGIGQRNKHDIENDRISKQCL